MIPVVELTDWGGGIQALIKLSHKEARLACIIKIGREEKVKIYVD